MAEQTEQEYTSIDNISYIESTTANEIPQQPEAKLNKTTSNATVGKDDCSFNYPVVQEPPLCVPDSRAPVQANIHQESPDAGTGECAATGRTRRQSLERMTKMKIGCEYAKWVPQLDNTYNEDLMPNLMPFPILPADLPPARQTARSRTASESSGSHSPTQANTPPQSPGIGFDDCAATGRSRKQSFERENVLNTSLEYQLPPGISSHKVHGWSVKTNTNQNTRIYTYPDYKHKDKRLVSYEIFTWPLLEPSAELLAENGMFYDGICTDQDGTVVTDMVYCYKCGGTLSRFEAQDDPQVEHRLGNPECFTTVWVP